MFSYVHLYSENVFNAFQTPIKNSAETDL